MNDGSVECSCLLWLVRSVLPFDRIRFVRNHLRRGVRYDSGFRWVHADDDEAEEKEHPAGERRRLRFSFSGAAGERSEGVHNDEMVRKFTEKYLCTDGVFLLRLIAHNTNGITATEVTKEMWDLWYDRQMKKATEQSGETSSKQRIGATGTLQRVGISPAPHFGATTCMNLNKIG